MAKTVDRYALARPVHVPVKTAHGFTLSLARQALHGQMDEVIATVQHNVRLLRSRYPTRRAMVSAGLRNLVFQRIRREHGRRATYLSDDKLHAGGCWVGMRGDLPMGWSRMRDATRAAGG